MKLFHPYYSYLLFPYLFTSPVSNILENKCTNTNPIYYLSNLHHFSFKMPTTNFVKKIEMHEKRYNTSNISEYQIQRFIKRIKKHDFTKKKEIPIEDY